MSSAEKITFEVNVGRSQWDENMGGWRCSALRLPGTQISGLYTNSQLVDTVKYECDKESGIVRWADDSPPREALIKLDIEEELTPKKQADKWKKLSIVLPFIGTLIGAILSIIMQALSNDPPRVSDNPPSTSSEHISLLQYYKNASDALPKVASLLEGSTEEVWLSGINFHITLDDRKNEIFEALQKGANIKILIMDPESNWMKYLEEDMGQRANVLEAIS